MDAQLNQNGTLLSEKLTSAMIACGFVEVQECKPGFSGKSCASM